MKKYFYIIMLMLIVLFFGSCSGDEPIIEHTLTVTILPINGGNVSPMSGIYEEGSSISLFATPSAEYNFKNWTGSATGTSNPVTVVMSSTKSVTAVFEKKDDDNDGVTNDVDNCPDTPTGESVDADGCSTSQLDTDGDGVMDNVDLCPDTPSGEDVDADGCSVVGFKDVTNPVTGKVWMDRNLGATRVATSSTDEAAYGDLYQWGRSADGHQLRSSSTTSTLSSTDEPGHASFIIPSFSPGLPRDWRSPQNDNLWQGLNGVNNPCPSGYRIPTQAEWEEEVLSWYTHSSSGAFASPLKLPLAGGRSGWYDSDGSLYHVGSEGYYWSSTAGTTHSGYLYFSRYGTSVPSLSDRSYGLCVRCIKD